MYQFVVFKCGVDRFCLALMYLILDKSSFPSQESLTFSSSTWVQTTLPACIRENLTIFQDLLAQKAFLVLVHMMVSIRKRYSRTTLRCQLPNYVVASAPMVLKASRQVCCDWPTLPTNLQVNYELWLGASAVTHKSILLWGSSCSCLLITNRLRK